MGVSFKVAKAGKRYQPKVVPIEDKENDKEPQTTPENGGLEVGVKVDDHSIALVESGAHLAPEDCEVSLTVALFPSGFCVGKANELFNDVPKRLHPYDRASKMLFSAIEHGILPGDAFDGIPCNYVKGTLLCEIQDFRNISSEDGDNASSMEKSPIIYKVFLQMCMENVVKDIASFSDDSWTYNDLLEVESRILKALQPVLNLSPKPGGDKFCDKPLRKKLDLAICCRGRRKRRLNDASTTDLVFSNVIAGTKMSEISPTRKLDSQSDLSFQAREVPCSPWTISRSLLSPKENNILQGATSQCFSIPSQSDNQQYSSKVLIPSDCVLSAKQYNDNYGIDGNQKRALSCDDGDSDHENIINQGPTIKKPKEEPLSFSEQELSGKNAETSLATEFQWMRKPLHQQIEAEKVLHRSEGQKHPPLSAIYCQQPTFERDAGNFTCKNEEVAMEVGTSLALDAGKKINYYSNTTDEGNQSDLHESMCFNSSDQERFDVNEPSNVVLLNYVDQSSGMSILTNEVASKKRKTLKHSLGSEEIASADSCQDNFLLTEASIQPKRKSTKVSTTNATESLAGTSHEKATNTICPAVNMERFQSFAPTTCISGVKEISRPVGLPSSFSAIDDHVLDRFLKVQMITQRYNLNDRESSLGEGFGTRQFYHVMPLVAFHLKRAENSRKLNCASTASGSDSYSSPDTNLSVLKTRTLAFVHSSSDSQRNVSGNTKAQDKLIITENSDEGIMKASFIYGNHKDDPIELPCLQSFPDSRHADLFASQFTSLMAREGYSLDNDQTETDACSIDECSTTQQLTETSEATLATQARGFTPTMVPRQSSYLLGPTSSSTSVRNPIVSLSGSAFSGGHFCTDGNRNIQSTMQIPPNQLSNTLHDIAAQFSPMNQQWQDTMRKRAFIQNQIMQRERIQQQLLQRTERPGATTNYPDPLQLGGNIGLEFSGNVMGVGTSTSMSMNRYSSGTGNFCGVSTPAAPWSTTRTAELQGWGALSGLVPACAPGMPGIGYNFLSQQPVQSFDQLQFNLMLPQREEYEPSVQQLQASSLAEQLGHPPMEQHFPLSPQKTLSARMSQEMEPGNGMVGRESPQPSSRTRGSMCSSSTSSSMGTHRCK